MVRESPGDRQPNCNMARALPPGLPASPLFGAGVGQYHYGL